MSREGGPTGVKHPCYDQINLYILRSGLREAPPLQGPLFIRILQDR